MLRGLRNATSNWLGKTIMGLVVAFLIVSFAIWGIGDIFRGFGASTVAKIGDTEITVEQFRQLYNDRLQQYARRIGRPLTPDQARAAGIEQQILAQLVAETVLDDRARALGLAVSDAEVARQIMQDPSFRSLTGQFDQQRFLAVIRQAGYTEQRYVAEQKRLTLRQQLAGSIAGDVKAPETAAAMLSRYENEERDIEYVVFDASRAGEIATPSEEQLRALYEQRKLLFRAPEYRKLAFLTVSPAEIAKSIEVDAADVRKAYESRISRWSTPEKRQVQQIPFQSPEEAQAASDRIKAGTSFETIAAERKIPAADLDLGLVAKSDMLDPAMANAAFALPDGGVSDPVKGRFTTAILRVSKIEPGRTTPLADVEAEIRKDLALERARALVTDRRDKIEDELASGLRLDEVAPKVGLAVQRIAAVDRSGRAPDGGPVALPEVDLLGPAFTAQAMVENDPIQLPGGGYLWFEVESIMPSRERAFDEVKDRVADRWRADQAAERLAAKAEEFKTKLAGGAKFSDLAAAELLRVETAKGLKRRGASPLPPGVVADVFQTPKDAVMAVTGTSPSERVVFRVTDIRAPGFDPQSAETKKLLETLSGAFADDLMAQYVGQLQADLGVKINQAALNQAVGRGSAE